MDDPGRGVLRPAIAVISPLRFVVRQHAEVALAGQHRLAGLALMPAP
jgi:hypothetical protein